MRCGIRSGCHIPVSSIDERVVPGTSRSSLVAEMQWAAEDEGVGRYDDTLKHYKHAWVFAGKALA